MGSDATAACGGLRELSEWQRSADDAGVHAKEAAGHRNREVQPRDDTGYTMAFQRTDKLEFETQKEIGSDEDRCRLVYTLVSGKYSLTKSTSFTWKDLPSR